MLRFSLLGKRVHCFYDNAAFALVGCLGWLRSNALRFKGGYATITSRGNKSSLGCPLEATTAQGFNHLGLPKCPFRGKNKHLCSLSQRPQV